MSINASDVAETSILDMLRARRGLHLAGIRAQSEGLVSAPSFPAPKQRKESINPQDSTEMRIL